MIAAWFNFFSDREARLPLEYTDGEGESSDSGTGNGDPATIQERYPLFQARAE